MPLTPDDAAVNRSGFFRRNWIYVTGTLLFILINGWFVYTGNQGDTLVAINKFRSPFLDVFFRVGTHFAEPVAYLGVLIVVSAFSYRKGIFAILSGTAAGVVSGLLKTLFSQPRPMRWFYDNYQEIWHSLHQFDAVYRNWAETTSFPSGHATSAFALYGFLAFNATRGKKRIQLICLGFAAMVAFSRMYLLYHFQRDITAGAALGLLVGIIVYLLKERFFPNAAWMDQGWLDYFRKDPVAKGQAPSPTE